METSMLMRISCPHQSEGSGGLGFQTMGQKRSVPFSSPTERDDPPCFSLSLFVFPWGDKKPPATVL